MCKILLPINPIHITNIFANTKKFEYRRVNPKRKIDKIIIYSTYPVMKIVGEVKVEEILYKNKQTIWDETKHFAGINKAYYDKYFKNKDKAVAYKLGAVKIYNKPKSLQQFKLKSTPQSFIYLD